jgi:hypothetical protein
MRRQKMAAQNLTDIVQRRKGCGTCLKAGLSAFKMSYYTG